MTSLVKFFNATETHFAFHVEYLEGLVPAIRELVKKNGWVETPHLYLRKETKSRGFRLQEQKGLMKMINIELLSDEEILTFPPAYTPKFEKGVTQHLTPCIDRGTQGIAMNELWAIVAPETLPDGRVVDVLTTLHYGPPAPPPVLVLESEEPPPPMTVAEAKAKGVRAVRLI